MTVTAKINGQEARIMIDSGATGNFLAQSFARKHRLPWVKKIESVPLQNFDGTPVSTNGGRMDRETAALQLRVGLHQEEIRMDLTNIPGYDAILGKPWMKRHNPVIDWRSDVIEEWRCSCRRQPPVVDVRLITHKAFELFRKRDPDAAGCIWYRPQKAQLSAARTIPEEYAQYSELFAEESNEDALPYHASWDHEIPLVEGKEPRRESIYPLSADKLEALRSYLDENLAKGFIRESSSPARYPILFVPKKDGSLRLCVDYRKLNNITVKNSYPLPLISEIQDRLQGAKIFTKFDIPGAYNRIRMKQGEEWKTAFGTRFGHYEYLVMPFGLTNAPATFQSFINNVLRKYLDVFVVVYLDDILVYSKTEEEHIEHVKKVLQALQEANLRVKLDKTQFHVQEVEFLGFIVTSEGMKMDKAKVESVTSWPAPTSVKEVQSFLGFANYYRKFIKDYSKIAAPMTELTKGEKSMFSWTNQAQIAFEELKQRFTTAPILTSFDPSIRREVETDASDGAIGAVLSQPGPDRKLRPVAFYSRKLTPTEQNYEIHDKELLAIVDSFKQWRVYLEGSKEPVKVFTDHKNLLYFTTTKVLNRRQVRWSEEMSNYNFEITYRKGSENGRADALSRRADYMRDMAETSHAILQEAEDGTMSYNRKVSLAATLQILNDAEEREMRLATAKDNAAQGIINDLDNHPDFEYDRGLLTFENRIYVPLPQREEIVTNYHESRVHGHQGTWKTMERISRTYFFPNMRKTVEDVLKKCDVCKRTKHGRHKPYGMLKSPKTPKQAWKSIALDWVTKLPLSKEPMTDVEYDSILVITDRLTKYGYFIPYLEASTAEDLAYWFLRTICANHGMPEEIISDRDRLLTSHFWTSLMQQLGTKHKLSTAYHPETDGQTERLNQTLEQYLRCYVNYQQDNWVGLLPLAQFAYNSASTETTKVSPFFANYGFDPEIHRQPLDLRVLSDAARVKVDRLKQLQEYLSTDIQFLAARSATYHNKKRETAPALKEGDKVYLLRKNIATTRPSNKLDHTKMGPFRIDKVKGPVNYQLQLPPRMKIHPVFHVSLLEPADPSTPLMTGIPENYLQDPNSEYEIQKILDDDTIDGQRHYLIKWKGFNTSENTWEPPEHLTHCQDLIRQYHRKKSQEELPSPRSRESRPARKSRTPRQGRTARQ